MSRWTTMPAALLLAALALSSAGCTQVAQLRGVAGGQVSAVRAATNDALVWHDVAIRVAPVCGFDGSVTYTCAGTTTDGSPIASTAVVRSEFGASTGPYGEPAPADVSLVVTVGGATLYDGTVEDVLQRSGQQQPDQPHVSPTEVAP
jgi:hypothetical protein